MASYLVSMFKKEIHGWSEITSEEMTMTAQANPAQLRRDIIENTQEAYLDTEAMDDGMIDRATSQICNTISDIDGDDLIVSEVRRILSDLLDSDQVDVEAIDIGEILDVSIEVDEAALHDEIENNLAANDLTYTSVMDALGTLIFEVYDADDDLTGKVLITWLRG